MNKLLLAALAGLVTTGIMEARMYRNGGNCGTNRSYCASKSERSCAKPCAKKCGPSIKPPVCCKTIQVPRTVMDTKVIEVPAEEVRTPNPDRIIRHPQPCEEVRIPLPQCYRTEYRDVPDEIEYVKVPDTISYRCPADCDVKGR
jgi:hypothetical protein